MGLLRMPRRFLRGGVLRLLLTVFAVACGVALVCAIDLVNRAVYEAFVDIVDTMAGRAALHVTAGEGGLFPEEVAKVVAAVQGVELAVPVVSSWAFTTDGSGEQLTVHGVDITDDDAIRVYEPAGSSAAAPEEPLLFLNQRDSIMLTEAFAARHGLEVEDAVELETPTGRRRFTVRSLLAPKGIARVQGGNLLVMDIAAAELAFTERGLVNRVDVVVRQDADISAVRDAVTAVLPPGLRVEAPEQRRLDLHRVMHSVQTLLQAVAIFGLVAAFLIAFSRLNTAFEARVGQLAMLRAVGVRSGRVGWELVKESLLVAGAGIALGIPLGVGLGHMLLPVIATTTAIGAKLVAADAVLTIRASSIALAGAMGFGAVLLAALLPARRAGRVPIVETLQGRHGEREDGGHKAATTRAATVTSLAAVAVLVHLYSHTSSSGLVASTFVVIATALVTRPVIAALAAPLTWLGPRVGGPVGRYAVATLLRAPRRTALTVTTLGIGFGTVIWLWTLARSFEQSVIEVMPGVLRGDLVVSSANIGAGYVEAPLEDGILGQIADVSGVGAVVGEQTADWRYADGPIALNAFDARYFVDTTFGRWRLSGRSLPDATGAVARGEAVLVSENFVHNVGDQVGDVVTLETPSGPVSLRIAGVAPDFLSSRGTILLSREQYRRYWLDGHITHALVATTPGTDVDQVRSAIARTLGQRYHLRVLGLTELVGWFSEQVRRAFSALHILGALVLVVVLVGVGDALSAGVLERTGELGVARAVGARRNALGRMLVAEALLLAALGIVVATAFGFGLGLLWVESTFPALVGWTLSLHFPGTQAMGVAVGAFVVCLVAAYVPAARAVRLDPVVALRRE